LKIAYNDVMFSAPREPPRNLEQVSELGR